MQTITLKQHSLNVAKITDARKAYKVPVGSILLMYSLICERIPRKEIIATMIREDENVSKEKCEQIVDSLCQWLSLVGYAKNEGLPLQMLATVGSAWHAFILNTKLYREFCTMVFGFIVDHDPIEAMDQEIPREEYGLFTLWALRQVFGERVNPILADLAENVTCCYFSSDEPDSDGQRVCGSINKNIN